MSDFKSYGISLRCAISLIRVKGTVTVKESANEGKFYFKLRIINVFVSVVNS
jgi:hypothetical protein